MKKNAREWLPTALLCGLLVGVAIASTRAISARSSTPNPHDDVELLDESMDLRESPKSRSLRLPPGPPNAPAASVPLETQDVSIMQGESTGVSQSTETGRGEEFRTRELSPRDGASRTADENRRKLEAERRERLKPKARGIPQMP